ncbi:hypothetical protein ACRAWD_20210 [Caulobacter segnis]
MRPHRLHRCCWCGSARLQVGAGHRQGGRSWFSSPAIVVEMWIAIIGFFAWVIWELNEKHHDRRPVAVPLEQFRHRHDRLLSGLCGGHFFGNNLLLPLWLADAHGGYARHLGGSGGSPAGWWR